jgi:hypothetical protein
MAGIQRSSKSDNRDQRFGFRHSWLDALESARLQDTMDHFCRTGALLSVISSSLSDPERIKDWAGTKSDFSHLRIDSAVLLTRMKLHPDFDVSETEKTMETFSRRFGDLTDRIRNDFLHTNRLDIACKKELDQVIFDQKLWL